MRIMRLPEEEAKNMNFAQLCYFAVEALSAAEGTSVSQAEVIRRLVENGSPVSTPALLSYLKSKGLISGNEGSESVDIKTSAPVASSSQEKEAPEPSPIPANEQEKEESIPQPVIDLYLDEGGRILDSEGKFVCPLCIRDRVPAEEIFRADSIRSIGPHIKAHDSKDRGWVNELVDTLPPFPGHVAEKTEEEPPAPVASPTVVEEHRTLTVEESVKEELQQESAIFNNASVDKILEKQEEIMERLDRMEAVIANLVIVGLSIPDEARQQLYQQFASKRASVLADLLMKEL